MQNIATTVASKALVAVVAAAMIFSAFVTPAKAATAEELQKMINDLMAQMAALGGTPATTGGSSASVCPFTWTRDLKTGATGADVMTLQKFLNSNADTRVAATGAGSAGMETQTFGPATAAAVSKFQVMHRADILTPAGLTNPTGFFGPSTRAKANALCVKSTTDGSDDNGSDDNASGDLQGEANFTEATLDAASDDTVEEGAEDAEIAEFTVSFEDGDASISRLDVEISTSSNVKNWDILDTVSIWVDGDMVADIDASDKDSYQSDDETLRFSGLDIVVMEDEDLDITIAATFQDNVDSSDRGDFNVDVTGMRWFDADGVAETETDSSIDVDPVQFTLEQAGSDDEIIVKSSENDPDSTTIKLETDKKSDFVHVFSFDIDTDDSTNDIELDTVVVKVTTTSALYTALVDDAELEIDGTTIDDVTVDSTGNLATLTFDVDGDVTIDAGDRVEAKLMLKFKALSTEGATIQASIVSGGIDGEGAEDEVSTGAATGDVHTLRSEGAVIELDSSSATKDVNSDATATDDEGVFTLKFDVTAFESDLFINKTAASGTTMGTAGVNFEITDGSGNAVGTTTPNANLASNAKTEGGQFKVSEGETKTFTLTVEYDPGVSGFYAVRLYSLNFKNVAGNPTVQQRALPAEDFETDSFSI